MTRCSRSDEEFRAIEYQLEQANSRLSAKTETIVRLGKDLEVAAKEKHNLTARCSTLERNLQRSEKNVETLLISEERLKTQFKAEKKTLEAEIDRLKKEVFKLQLECKEYKEEKVDLQRDCRTLRQQIARFEVDKLENDNVETACSIGAKRTSRLVSDEHLEKYEKLWSSYKQMESDLHTVLGVKEELVKEREILLQKVERLSQEMSYLLNGDPRRVAEDLDSLLAENRFLKAQLSTANEESESIKSTLAKYRAMTEKNQQTSAKLPSPKAGDSSLEDKSNVAVVNMKQIRELLQSHSIELDDSDLRSITTILLDVCNDKQMAIAHLRRANKVLGSRLHEVEGHLAAVEATKSRSCSPRVPEDAKSGSSKTSETLS